MAVILEAGHERDNAAIKLATRNGRWIMNERRNEWAPAELRAAANSCEREHPNATLRSSTAVYNCMGLVFASRRTWVDINQLGIIVEDDGYEKLANPNEVQIGDIALYKYEGEVTHVGIIVRSESIGTTGTPVITVLSKWGVAGEYVHSVHDVPDVYGEAEEYWTERKEKP